MAAYRRGGGDGLKLQPPLTVSISEGSNAAVLPAELANLRLDVSVGSSKVQPLFMPVFIMEFPRFGANFRVFVCGSTGRVGGEAHTSPLKAYVLPALPSVYFCNTRRRYVLSGAVVTAVLSSLPLNSL